MKSGNKSNWDIWFRQISTYIFPFPAFYESSNLYFSIGTLIHSWFSCWQFGSHTLLSHEQLCIVFEDRRILASFMSQPQRLAIYGIVRAACGIGMFSKTTERFARHSYLSIVPKACGKSFAPLYFTHQPSSFLSFTLCQLVDIGTMHIHCSVAWRARRKPAVYILFHPLILVIIRHPPRYQERISWQFTQWSSCPLCTSKWMSEFVFLCVLRVANLQAQMV